MKAAWEIVGEKWDELAKRRDIAQFTVVERMIWFLVILRVDIEMEGFFSVLADSMTSAELRETIGYVRALGLPEVAGSLEQAMELLKANGIYDANWEVVQWELPETVDADLFYLGKQIWEERPLWKIDEKLAALLSGDSER